MIWPFAFYFLLFSGFVFFTPYLVILYRELGFNGGQIGMLTGLTPLVTLTGATMWTRLADSTRRHRLVMAGCLASAVVGLAVFPSLRFFLPVLALVLAITFFFSPVSSLVDSATMYMLGDRKAFYGRVRVGGTIGFGIAAPVAGLLVERFGLKVAFWGAAAIFLIAFLISSRLSYSVRGVESQYAPVSTGLLLRRPGWIGFLTLAFAAGIALAANLSFFYPYLQELGMDGLTMGLAFALGTVGEIPIMFYGDRLLKRFSAYRLLLIGMAATGLRLLLFSVTTTPALVFANQLFISGLAFPVMWLAGVAYADELSPEGMKSTGQGLFTAAVFGIGHAVGGMIGGPLLEGVGGRGLNLVFGIVVIAMMTGVLLVAEARRARAAR
ncbi:MAG TPA: MFS transporter [Anaerolineales bacterium]|nr:MFS transporter [Anaerolineales bacterium]